MEGRTAPVISEILKVHRANVSIWISKYEQHGTNGLLEGQRPGRPGELSHSELNELTDIIDSADQLHTDLRPVSGPLLWLKA